MRLPCDGGGTDAHNSRYRVGADSKYLVSALSVASEYTVDALFTASDPRLPFVPPASAPSNGSAVAWARYQKNWTRFFVQAAIVSFVLYRVKKSFV